MHQVVLVLVCLLLITPVNAHIISVCPTESTDLHKHVVQQAMYPRRCVCKQVHTAQARLHS